ncbi:flavin reductase family protein [Microbacterium sp. ZW T5_56]|uniref:flavin reductase family protein n=1 Tax=Microbacterium sp. ZW T5_56 TaxID=3378081 RepID=UPI0038521928
MSLTSTDLATEFKAAFREHPAGIALITADSSAGPVGLTASSVASVAVDPAALVFSVTRTTGSAGLILSAGSFLVHLLDARHAGIAAEFAVSGGERFTPEQGWATLPTGEPHLTTARVALRCRSLQQVPVGSSMLVVSEVIDIHVASAADATMPLVYHDRAFRAVGEPI